MIRGQIVVSMLTLGGNGSITMLLGSGDDFVVDRVALVK
jgi:hypothetical protein